MAYPAPLPDDLPSLQALYDAAAARLRSALLDGQPWDTVLGYRRDVTELQAALYQKKQQEERTQPGQRTQDPAS